MTTKTETGGIDAIERTPGLRADPERVWPALTRPEEIARWFGDTAELEAPGGGGRVVRLDEVRPLRRLWVTAVKRRPAGCSG